MAANPHAILVLRPAQQAGELLNALEKSGFQGISFPTVEIQPYRDALHQQRIENLALYDKIIFISRNAVDYFFQNNALADSHADIIAIGKATAAALRLHSVKQVFDNQQGVDSEALLETAALQSIDQHKILIVRGHGGREHLRNVLLQRGALVDYLEVYQRQKPEVDSVDFAHCWQQGITAVIATSNEIITNLLSIAGNTYTHQLLSLPLVVISERMHRYASELGFSRIGLAASPANDEIVKSLKDLLKQANLD